MVKETEEILIKLLKNNELRMEVFKEEFGVEKIVITKKVINQKSSETNRDKLNKVISEKLIKLGIPEQEDGYKYLHEAILIGYNNKNAIYDFNRLIYPEVVKKFSVSEEKVKKGMKKAIKMAWSKKENVEEQKIFRNTIYEKYGMPTNKQLITVIVNELKIFEKEITK